MGEIGMEIQSTLITEQTQERAVIEMLLADNPDAEAAGQFLKVRLSIPSAPIPRVSELQLVALRHTREIVTEHIRALQALLGRHNVDIP